jgi:hypothetical protein
VGLNQTIDSLQHKLDELWDSFDTIVLIADSVPVVDALSESTAEAEISQSLRKIADVASQMFSQMNTINSIVGIMIMELAIAGVCFTFSVPVEVQTCGADFALNLIRKNQQRSLHNQQAKQGRPSKPAAGDSASLDLKDYTYDQLYSVNRHEDRKSERPVYQETRVSDASLVFQADGKTYRHDLPANIRSIKPSTRYQNAKVPMIRETMKQLQASRQKLKQQEADTLKNKKTEDASKPLSAESSTSAAVIAPAPLPMPDEKSFPAPNLDG